MRIKINPLARLIYKCRYVQIGFVILAFAVLLLSWGMAEQLKVDHWASWVQAVGSITALGVAIYLSHKQSKDARSILEISDAIATKKKHAAYSTIANVALTYVRRVEVAFQNDVGFSGMVVDANQFDRKRKELMQAISAIPIHEVGSYPAVEALMQMITGMADLDKMMTLANAKMESYGINSAGWIPHETLFIRMNCSEVVWGAEAFIAALEH